MPKLTRQQEKDHEKAEALLALTRELTRDEKTTVFENFHPGARHLQGKNAAYFTPQSIADVVARNVSTEGLRILDLGAGIGGLPFAIESYSHWEKPKEVVCLELNPEYVKVGRQLVSDATWICGDMFDLDLLQSLGRFDAVISNPPYGNHKSGTADKSWLSVRNPLHFSAVEIAVRMTGGTAVFILPRADLPWHYSMYPIDIDALKRFRRSRYPSSRNFRPREGHAFLSPDRYTRNLQRLLKAFPDMYFGCVSEDVALYVDDWSGVAPRIEVISIGFDPPDYSHKLPALASVPA